MAHYGINVDAKLEFGASTATPLPAIGADTFTIIPLLESVAPPSVELSVATFNVHNQAAPLSLGGKVAQQSIEFTMALDWVIAGVGTLYTDANTAGGRRRNWKLTYPNGRLLTFQGFISKWSEEAMEAGEEVVEHRVAVTITLTSAVTAT